MTTVANRNVLEDLQREIGRIEGGGGAFTDASKVPDYRAYTPAPPDARLKDEGRTAAPSERGPFGRWLLEQKDRDGFIGLLAQAARRDPAFPKDGDPEAVRRRMGLLGADPDMLEAFEDAELDWSSY